MYVFAIIPPILKTDYETFEKGTFCPISASGSNFNPRNILYIPAVEIFAFLELEQKLQFFKGLYKYLINQSSTKNHQSTRIP